MATVHRVIDLTTQTTVALKQLRLESSAEEASTRLFEREYLTLAQLAHPRVVQVFDYGVDEQGPYYTMELLDGGDLQTLAPLHWQKSCEVARDVCSALALLHSRRLVYRDLSPRNVRCTNDGSAKLIDFGALTPMGLARELVGTPPCIAPEALNLQPLDGRTDLFALGATLYFALVQRHAYPARDLAQLRDVWRSRPRRPSEIVAGIPAALDQLIMDLLQLEIASRPANAAEVMARLSAISGARWSEQSVVALSYLSNPNLIGRKEQLARIRAATEQALHGAGGSLVIFGVPGVGRSRLLDACVLEAKLAGLLVVRIDARAFSERRDFAVARIIGSHLLEAARPLAVSAAQEHFALLSHVVPALGGSERTACTATDAASETKATAEECVQSWLLAFARTRPLLIAVDDLALLDDESVAFLALLSQHASESGVLLVSTSSMGEMSSTVRAAMKLLRTRSTELSLECLTHEQVEELLTSVFGEVPNLAALANYLHAIASGNPRDTMQVAQHLVSEGLVQYSGGAWSLPDRARLSGLPASMREALTARAAKLSPAAQRLALAFALEPALQISLDECVVLADERDPRTTFQTLEDLVLEDVLMLYAARYGLRQQAWTEPLLSVTSAALQSRVHAALAEVLWHRHDDVRATSHLFASGQSERGLDLLLSHVNVTTKATESDPHAFFAVLKQLPQDWLRTYERALELCRELNRPARDSALLLSRLEGIASDAIGDTCAYHHIQGRLEQLSVTCGLDLFSAMAADEEDVQSRMKRAFAAADRRYQSLSEHARVYPPLVAVRQFAQSMLSAIGVIASTHDFEALRKLPPIAPLTALFPAMGVVESLVEGVAARITGRNERAVTLYDALLSGPFAAIDHNLSRAYQAGTRLRLLLSIATLEAGMGLSRCLERLRELETEPLHAAQVMLVRHLYFAWQGDLVEAERCKRRAEVLQVQSRSHQTFEGQHLFSELSAYALAADLTAVKRAADAIDARAGMHPAWRPMLHYARGEYQRIRGDLVAALEELETALRLGKPGEHPVWASLAGAHVRVLVELGRHERAVERAQKYLHDADAAELGYGRTYVMMPYSIALAQLGRHDDAQTLANAAVSIFVDLGTTGLNLALAHETRARVALLANDRAAFELAKQRATQSWPGAEKRLAGSLYPIGQGGSAEPQVDATAGLSILTHFTTQLATCRTDSERGQCGLSYLMLQSGATGALLYACSPEGLRFVACGGTAVRSSALDARAAAYLELQLDRDAMTQGGDDEQSASDAELARYRELLKPVLLLHQAAGGPCMSGVVLLTVPPGRPYTHPAQLAAELSRCLVERGDASPKRDECEP